MKMMTTIQSGDLLPEMKFKPTSVQLFMYNAALWNAHRIHFDLPYATEVEGYPELVIAGPLMGDWMNQCLLNWLGDEGRLQSFEYSNRKAAYIGETLWAGGEVLSYNQVTKEIKLKLFIKNEMEEIIAPGIAIVRF